MTLRKTKVSIVINAIYVLVASALCIITIMDAAEGFGFSYFPGLIAFVFIIAIGLILRKLLSYTANSDKFKALTEKGDLLGLIIFLILLVFSVIFRVASYSWNGLGGTAYFEIAKVTEQPLGHYVHAGDDWYLRVLRGIFFLFGNRVFIAAIFNCVLQMAAVALGFFAFRRMLGIVPALFFTAFWTITGFSVHEALTLNSRNLVFFLITLTLFVLSLCVPASSGKFFGYLFTGILTAVSIYADIAGFVIIPFIIGILLNDRSTEDDNSIGLRLSKMFFTIVSVVFGLVLLIFVDSLLTSANPFKTLSSIAALYRPADMFTMGFSYMTSYAEIVVMAVIVALGLFNVFFADDEPRLILLVSTLMILIINNFGMTYLENDGREIFFMFGALAAGIAFKELFPAQITGDVFKASAELYDNEFSDPDKGYVPTGLKKNSDPSETPDDLSDLDIKPDETSAGENAGETAEVATVAETADKNATASETIKTEETVNTVSEVETAENDAAAVSKNAEAAVETEPADVKSTIETEEADVKSTEKKEGQSDMDRNEQREFSPIEMFDAVILPGHGPASQLESTSQSENTDSIEGSQSQASSQSEDTAQTQSDDTVQAQSGSEPAPEEKKKSVYVPFKPQLKPEYRRRPGAWMQALNEKNKTASDENEIKLGAQDKDNAPKDTSEDVVTATTSEAVEDTSVKAASGSAEDTADKTASDASDNTTAKKAPERAANGAILLDNPIPHPVRKTERKPMEYDINVSDSMMDYDIKVSDNDDYDI
jgi:hypothetical protein